MPGNPLILPAGSLRNLISIEQSSTTPDSFGQPLNTWTAVLQTRAAINFVNNREIYQADQLTEQVSHKVTIRWPGGLVSIVPGMRVVFGSHVYKVQAVNNVQQRNRVLEILVLELNGGL